MIHRHLLAAALIAAVPTIAFAHSIQSGPHGGEVEDANPGPALHFEVVVKGSTLTVYLSDEDGHPIPSQAVSGSAIVLANKTKDRFDLAPKSDNALQGAGTFSSDPDMRALISLTISGEKQQALFSRLQP